MIRPVSSVTSSSRYRSAPPTFSTRVWRSATGSIPSSVRPVPSVIADSVRSGPLRSYVKPPKAVGTPSASRESANAGGSAPGTSRSTLDTRRVVGLVGERRDGRREPGGGQGRQLHAVRLGAQPLRLAAGRGGRRVGVEAVRARRVGEGPRCARQGETAHAPVRIGRDGAHRPARVGHRLRILVGVERGRVRPRPTRRRPRRDVLLPAGRREDVTLPGRERARHQGAVGVVSVAVGAPARIAPRRQPIGRVVVVFDARAVRRDDRARPARGVALVVDHLVALVHLGEARAVVHGGDRRDPGRRCLVAELETDHPRPLVEYAPDPPSRRARGRGEGSRGAVVDLGADRAVGQGLLGRHRARAGLHARGRERRGVLEAGPGRLPRRRRVGGLERSRHGGAVARVRRGQHDALLTAGQRHGPRAGGVDGEPRDRAARRRERARERAAVGSLDHVARGAPGARRDVDHARVVVGRGAAQGARLAGRPVRLRQAAVVGLVDVGRVPPRGEILAS